MVWTKRKKEEQSKNYKRLPAAYSKRLHLKKNPLLFALSNVLDTRS
jgi:hypothetical protein